MHPSASCLMDADFHRAIRVECGNGPCMMLHSTGTSVHGLEASGQRGTEIGAESNEPQARTRGGGGRATPGRRNAAAKPCLPTRA
eukprot:scaffold616_cov120-Isochrysis_galbana.AAC.3